MTNKYLIIHADDAGMAWSENKATQIGLLQGSITSCSLMVPCPWFYEMAQFCLKNPQVDYGIHLTLTGEWKTYPFRSITPANQIPSLVNSHGYFYPKRAAIRDGAVLAEVYLELKNQIEYALALGLKPTHLDSHMYTLGVRQDLIDLYQDLGREYKLPIVLSKKLIAYTGESPMNFQLPDKGCWEAIYMGSYDEFQNQGLANFYDQLLDNLEEGVSLILIHPALPSDEMKQITIDHPNFGARWRAIDADYFTSKHCQKKLEENAIELIDFRNPKILNILGA
ncbi:polysaccharide deacetylase family protein [Flavobacteriaceae bacterium]|nr:polysaccharide deacetylase family protein [Flavobacteriaceae bacterium]MDC3354878.1 polysaccharide deacetylase family protein [Flavobacteriaceae bacterium]